jgi:hypothetical protein
MKKIFLLASFGIIFIFMNSSCHDPHDSKFLIRNTSDSSVYFAFSYSYPDTSLSRINSVPHYNGNMWQKLLAHEGKYETTGVFDLNPTTFVFIFDAHTIETTPWDTIVKHYNILKRYQLTKDDMEKLDWVITYP